MLATIDRFLAPFTWLVAVVAIFALAVGPAIVGAKKEAAPEGAPQGGAVFADAGCGNCHTLAAARATGTIGPNLDDLKPGADQVEAVVRSGAGSMPSFEGRLSDAEIRAVADYVAGAY